MPPWVHGTRFAGEAGRNMGRRCTICDSTARPLIEQAILERQRQKDLIARFGVTRRQLEGHRTHMAAEAGTAIRLAGQGLLPLPPNLSEDKAGRMGQLVSAYDEMLDLRDKAREIFDGADGKDRDRVKLAAVGELRGIIETMAKLSLVALKLDEAGRSRDRGEPGLGEIKEVLLNAISRHPESREGIVFAIAELARRYS